MSRAGAVEPAATAAGSRAIGVAQPSGGSPVHGTSWLALPWIPMNGSWQTASPGPLGIPMHMTGSTTLVPSDRVNTTRATW